MKILNKMKVDLKINITTIIICIVAIGIVAYFYGNKVDKLKDNLEAEVKLKNALIDKVDYYKNKENEWTAEKLTIQASVKDLKDMTDQLTNSQKELLNKIKNVEKGNSVIAAALIDTKIILDSMRNSNVKIDSTTKTINFSDSTTDLIYSIDIKNVLQYNKDIPIISFKKFELPNKQFVNFQFKDNEKNYPISFTVSNSNKYIKVMNVESYAIPGLQKDIVDPTKWQKFTKWLDKQKNNIFIIGVSGGVGIVAGTVLLK